MQLAGIASCERDLGARQKVRVGSLCCVTCVIAKNGRNLRLGELSDASKRTDRDNNRTNHNRMLCRCDRAEIRCNEQKQRHDQECINVVGLGRVDKARLIWRCVASLQRAGPVFFRWASPVGKIHAVGGLLSQC